MAASIPTVRYAVIDDFEWIFKSTKAQCEEAQLQVASKETLRHSWAPSESRLSEAIDTKSVLVADLDGGS